MTAGSRLSVGPIKPDVKAERCGLIGSASQHFGETLSRERLPFDGGQIIFAVVAVDAQINPRDFQTLSDFKCLYDVDPGPASVRLLAESEKGRCANATMSPPR